MTLIRLTRHIRLFIHTLRIHIRPESTHTEDPAMVGGDAIDMGITTTESQIIRYMS